MFRVYNFTRFPPLFCVFVFEWMNAGADLHMVESFHTGYVARCAHAAGVQVNGRHINAITPRVWGRNA